MEMTWDMKKLFLGALGREWNPKKNYWGILSQQRRAAGIRFPSALLCWDGRPCMHRGHRRCNAEWHPLNSCFLVVNFWMWNLTAKNLLSEFNLTYPLKGKVINQNRNILFLTLTIYSWNYKLYFAGLLLCLMSPLISYFAVDLTQNFNFAGQLFATTLRLNKVDTNKLQRWLQPTTLT